MKQPPKSWAKLTLYDRIVNSLPRQMRPANLEHARRFVMTDRASERVREAMGSAPELIAENGEFAIPPFNTMWIEFNGRTMLKHRLLSGEHIDKDNTSDLHIGYFFNENEVTVFCEGDDLQPYPLPISYKLNTFMSYDQQREIADWFNVTRIGIDPFLWGHEMHRNISEPHRSMLRRQHSLKIGGMLLDMPEMERYKVYSGSAGELRNILAVLLTINQPAKTIQLREVPRERGLVKGKPLSYFGHSLIDIDIDRRRRINVFAKPKRGQANWQLRWHEVRGHFVHRFAKHADHTHEWEEFEPRRWKCQVDGCQARRTWREYPEGKGTAEKGFVCQERRIKTKHDSPANAL